MPRYAYRKGDVGLFLDEFTGSIPVVPELQAASSEASAIDAIGIVRRERFTKNAFLDGSE